MKINFIKILIACFLTNHLFGQQVNNTEFKTKTLEIFKDLDKERVPHGILLDFGMEFTNIQKFDGKLSDSVYSSSQSVSDCYKTLLMSRVRTVETGFIAPEEYTNRWFRQRTTGIIVLSGQFFKYSQFEKNAYPDRLNYDKDHFSDKFVENEWQNPYEEKELFTIAPPINSYKGFNFQVKLPQDLFLSNYLDELQSVEIDFSDGNGFRTVRFDELIEVANTMREQMGRLNQPELETMAVHLYKDDSEYFDSWYAFRGGNKPTDKIFKGTAKFKKDSCEVIREFVEDYYSNKKEYTVEVSGTRREEWFNVLTKAAPVIMEAIYARFDDVSEKTYFHFSDFSGGSMLMVWRIQY